MTKRLPAGSWALRLQHNAPDLRYFSMFYDARYRTVGHRGRMKDGRDGPSMRKGDAFRFALESNR